MQQPNHLRVCVLHVCVSVCACVYVLHVYVCVTCLCVLHVCVSVSHDASQVTFLIVFHVTFLDMSSHKS